MNAHSPPLSFNVGDTRHLLGTLVTLRADAAATGGAFSLVEIAVAPGQRTPPHHHEDAESFYVLEGEVTFVLDGRPVTKGPGGFVHVPGGTTHAFRNASADTSRMLGLNAPGGPHQRFFEEVGEPVATADAFPPLSAPDVPGLVAAGARNGITILPPRG